MRKSYSYGSEDTPPNQNGQERFAHASLVLTLNYKKVKEYDSAQVEEKESPFRGVAQLVARGIWDAEVGSSRLSTPTIEVSFKW